MTRTSYFARMNCWPKLSCTYFWALGFMCLGLTACQPSPAEQQALGAANLQALGREPQLEYDQGHHVLSLTLPDTALVDSGSVSINPDEAGIKASYQSPLGRTPYQNLFTGKLPTGRYTLNLSWTSGGTYYFYQVPLQTDASQSVLKPCRCQEGQKTKSPA